MTDHATTITKTTRTFAGDAYFPPAAHETFTVTCTCGFTKRHAHKANAEQTAARHAQEGTER